MHVKIHPFLVSLCCSVHIIYLPIICSKYIISYYLDWFSCFDFTNTCWFGCEVLLRNKLEKGFRGGSLEPLEKNISAHIYIPEKYLADLFLTKEGIGESPEMIYPQKTPTGEISRSLSNPRNVIALLQVVNPPTMGVKTDCPCLSGPQWPASKNYLNTQHLAGRLTHPTIS